MQRITTPGGETLVVLPVDEYERLLDAADVVAARKVRAEIKAGNEEMVSAEVVRRIVDGENPVRGWRRSRGLSARDLATRTGLSPGYISQIEGGKKEGSLAALKSIAQVLRVDLDDLV